MKHSEEAHDNNQVNYDSPEKKVQNTHSVELWREYFSERFETFEKRKLQSVSFRDLADGKDTSYTFVHIYRDYYPALLNAGQFFDEDIAMLYKYHVQIETLIRLFAFEAQYGVVSYMQGNFDSTVEKLSDQIYVTLKQIKSEKLLDENKKLIEESLRNFQSLYEIPPKWGYLLFYLFQISWSLLYKEKSWIEKYENQLLEEKKAGKSTQMLQLALVHFAFARKDDTNAFERLGENEKKVEMVHYLVWMKLLVDKQEWDRLLTWLLYLKPNFLEGVNSYYYHSDAREFFHEYLNYFWKYAQHTGDEDQYEEMLIEFLPITFYEYGEYLMVIGEHERWVELQVIMGYSPELIQRKDLKEVLSFQKETVLPIYHQTIDRLINERTRKSYQSAIKHLKTLRTIYFDLGEEERFSMYIDRIAAVYGRLRAFQEELRKGKFIS
ncbi:hypothetical protein KUV80_14335 [Fictibacillus nanhaiensis]|uniref:hypothetical protein n=1 Tax=Fictibacillus nanhaiensis TaxID=742169 RepID=UPI001C950FDF|nr:hypothetical protein [Fictibacillus nanhaiensis]MBY6037847.1 hypothetical protein [Fictibacillus nanhaiensis]